MGKDSYIYPLRHREVPQMIIIIAPFYNPEPFDTICQEPHLKVQVRQPVRMPLKPALPTPAQKLTSSCQALAAVNPERERRVAKAGLQHYNTASAGNWVTHCRTSSSQPRALPKWRKSPRSRPLQGQGQRLSASTSCSPLRSTYLLRLSGAQVVSMDQQ